MVWTPLFPLFSSLVLHALHRHAHTPGRLLTWRRGYPPSGRRSSLGPDMPAGSTVFPSLVSLSPYTNHIFLAYCSILFPCISLLTPFLNRFLLKYASRDEVELLGRGNGGVSEMRNAISEYEETSPLFGFLRYRRRNVLIKYLPDDCSRLIQGGWFSFFF